MRFRSELIGFAGSVGYSFRQINCSILRPGLYTVLLSSIFRQKLSYRFAAKLSNTHSVYTHIDVQCTCGVKRSCRCRRIVFQQRNTCQNTYRSFFLTSTTTLNSQSIIGVSESNFMLSPDNLSQHNHHHQHNIIIIHKRGTIGMITYLRHRISVYARIECLCLCFTHMNTITIFFHGRYTNCACLGWIIGSDWVTCESIWATGNHESVSNWLKNGSDALIHDYIEQHVWRCIQGWNII